MFRSTFLMLVPLHVCLISGNAIATEPAQKELQKGRVYLAGSIVDAACAIQVGNENQAVILQPTAINNLVNGDVPIQQPLNINITRCVTPGAGATSRSLRPFKVTFEGEGKNRFEVQGTAKGLAIQIKDGQGKLISPGVAVEDSSLSANNMTLNYSIALVGTGRSLEAGDFHATIKLNIQHF
ncbi:PAP fimbrial minor pilin protein precursor [compost metagenome]